MHRSPPGRTLRYWVTVTLKEAREGADIKPRTIAHTLDIDQSRIYKFERNQHWPAEVDQILAAYARALGIKDPRAFYAEALKRWRADGEAPRIESDPTQAARAASAVAAARTTRRRAG